MWTFFIILWMPFWLCAHTSVADSEAIKNDPFRSFAIHFKEEWFEKSNFSTNCGSATRNEANVFEEVCIAPEKIILKDITYTNTSRVGAIIRDDYTKILTKMYENPSEGRQTKNLTELLIKSNQVNSQFFYKNYLAGYSNFMFLVGMQVEIMKSVKAPRYFFNDTVTVDKCMNRTDAWDSISHQAIKDYQKRRIQTYTLVELLEEDNFMKDIRHELLDMDKNSPSSNKTLVREIIRMKLMAALRAQFGYESSLLPGEQLLYMDVWAVIDEKKKCKLRSIPEIVLTDEGIKEYKRRVEYYLEEAKKIGVDYFQIEPFAGDNTSYVPKTEMFDNKVHDDYDDQFDRDIDKREEEMTHPLDIILQNDESEIKAVSSLGYLVSFYDNRTDPQEKMKKFVNRFSFRDDVRRYSTAGAMYRLMFMTIDSTKDMNYFKKECDIYGLAIHALQHFHGSGLLEALPTWNMFDDSDSIHRVQVKLEDGKIKNFNVNSLLDQLEYTKNQESVLMSIKNILNSFIQTSNTASHNDFAFIDFMKSYLNTATGKRNAYFRCYEQSVRNFDNFTESLRKESKINKVFSYVFLRMLEEGKYLKNINQSKIDNEIQRLKDDYKIKEKKIEKLILRNDSNEISEELLQIRRNDLENEIKQLQTRLQKRLDILSNTTLIHLTTIKRLMEQEIQKYVYVKRETSKIDRDITAAVIKKLDFGNHQNLFNEEDIPYHEIMFTNEGLKEFQRRTQELLLEKKINY